MQTDSDSAKHNQQRVDAAGEKEPGLRDKPKGGEEDEDGDEMILPDFAAAKSLHQGSDITSDVIDSKLKDVSPR